jgi:uncharacterized membrane protein
MTDAALRSTLMTEIPPDTRTNSFLQDANVTGAERWASIAGGVALAAAGSVRRDVAGGALALVGAGLILRGLTGHCPIKHAAAARAESPRRQAAKAQGWSTAAFVHRAVTVNKPRTEVYAAWRDFANLQHFMENIEQIEMVDEKVSRWTVKAPLGRSVSWEAHVVEDAPGERIAWETAPGSQIQSAGWVEFRDGPTGRGTEVRARFAYRPPAGQVGRLVAKVLQREPHVQARRDLRRFKAWMEAGEIPVGHVPGLSATPQDLRL